jgi:hypothetical protein
LLDDNNHKHDLFCLQPFLVVCLSLFWLPGGLVVLVLP